MSCPDRGELLDRVLAGEDVPHLEECEDCADFVERFWFVHEACEGRPGELDLAVAEYIDEALEGVPPTDWAAVLLRNREAHHSIIVGGLLRRAERVRENPSEELALTAAAVALCDEIEKRGEHPPTQLFFDALKERGMALRAANDLDGALDALARASAVASRAENREQLDAIVALCTALTYSEADLGKFDEAIAMAERAEGVLELCGDRRRAVMARQAKAYALACMLQFDEALPLAGAVAAELDEIGGQFDAAIAHHLVAHCSVGVGLYEEALQHAAVAKQLYDDVGNLPAAARVSHVAARAIAGLGRFEEARAQFDATAEIVLAAGLYEVWVLDRLDYVAAALHHDPAADVRAEVEAVAVACFMLGRENSTMRRRYAAEALDYLRQLAKRDALTAEAADYVRNFVALNASRPAVRFRRPASRELVM